MIITILAVLLFATAIGSIVLILACCAALRDTLRDLGFSDKEQEEWTSSSGQLL